MNAISRKRSESTSFRTLAEAGPCRIVVLVDETVPRIGEDCVRAHKVPFETTDGLIEIASISDSIPLRIPPGRYVLQAELNAMDRAGMRANIWLNAGDCGREIFRQDETVNISGGLDLSAHGATQ